MLIVKQILLAVVGFSAGAGTAAGLFSFIIGLGVVSDFADRTHTGDCISFYEDCIMMGGILGNFIWLYPVSCPGIRWLMPVFGIFAGIFVGCWSMALAEALNIFPIFIRRVKLPNVIPYLILGMAVGKGVGAVLQFSMHW